MLPTYDQILAATGQKPELGKAFKPGVGGLLQRIVANYADYAAKQPIGRRMEGYKQEKVDEYNRQMEEWKTRRAFEERYATRKGELELQNWEYKKQQYETEVQKRMLGMPRW